MKNNPFNLNSITSQYDLVNCPIDYLCKEISETNTICIPWNKPGIKTLIENFVDTSITKFNIINTFEGTKLVIYAFIHIKILYIANTSFENLHSVHFDIPFCTSVSLGNVSSKIAEVHMFVKNGSIDQLDCKNLKIHTIFSIYPILNNNETSYNYNFNDDKITENKNYYCSENRENINFKNTTDSIVNCNNNLQSKNNANNENTTNDNSEIEFNIEYDMNSASVSNKYSLNNEENLQYDWE